MYHHSIRRARIFIKDNRPDRWASQLGPRVLLLLLLLLFAQTLFAQSNGEILNNSKILELVKMGLSEAVIVAKINKSVCRCDTSTAAIGKLKAAKVSDAIILAMINSSAEPTETPKPQFSETVINVPTQRIEKAATTEAIPADAGPATLQQISEPGIYLYEGGKFTFMEPTIYSGSKTNFLTGALTYGFKKTKIRAIVRGKSANLQVGKSRPEFYFLFSREYVNSAAVMSGFGGYAATSPNEFMMISMKVKENSREATLGGIGAISVSTGADDKDIREFSFEKIRPGLYKVVPKSDLAPGEYCIFYAGNSGAGNKVFDFGVRR